MYYIISFFLFFSNVFGHLYALFMAILHLNVSGLHKQIVLFIAEQQNHYSHMSVSDKILLGLIACLFFDIYVTVFNYQLQSQLTTPMPMKQMTTDCSVCIQKG